MAQQESDGTKGAQESPFAPSPRLYDGRLSARLVVALLLATLAPALCGASEADPAPGPFDWTLGEWQGTRTDGSEDDGGGGEPMTMRVEPILGGAGQARHLEVRHDGGTYRGFAVQLFDPELGRWVRYYANDVRGRFARLEGEIDGEPDREAGGGRSLWRSATPGRARESRLVSERIGGDRWRRTMSVSEDGGKSWRVLWIDDLERVAVAASP